MLLDLLFPKYCIGCAKLGRILCDTCRKEIKPSVLDVCPYCYRNSPGGKTHERCQKRNGLDGAISIVRYNAIAKKIVKNIKYRLAYDTFNQIVELFPDHWWRTEIFQRLPREEVLIQPIPLHSARLKLRGFNQAEIVARHLSKETGISITDCLKRIKNTLPQAKIATRKEREGNIKGAFAVTNEDLIRGKTIILVDDIFTSASTAKEATTALKKRGAAKVFLYAFAHGS
ncbi:ComF family protein [Candidatus Roizmanbacteria bacterium]|nr:MAG: ComF family protein [Candidatus Roizmanbacteria bacterium]